ncbi:MAG: hypothetical protein WCA08_20300 [Desulfoferrobacter sp.]
MKTKIGAALFILVILASSGLAMSDGTQQENFYNTCIDNKIAQCESKLLLNDSRSNTLCNYAHLNQTKAEFYENNRDELVQQMVEEDITMKPHRVDYFLNKAFFDQLPDGLALSK